MLVDWVWYLKYQHDGKTWESPVFESTVYHDCWGLIPWFIIGLLWFIHVYTMVYTILSLNICPVQMAIGSVAHFQTTVWSWGDVDGGNVPKLAMKYLQQIYSMMWLGVLFRSV